MGLGTEDKGTQFSTGVTEFLLGKLWPTGGGLGVPTIFAFWDPPRQRRDLPLEGFL